MLEGKQPVTGSPQLLLGITQSHNPNWFSSPPRSDDCLPSHITYYFVPRVPISILTRKKFYLSWFLIPFSYQIHSPTTVKNTFTFEKNSEFFWKRILILFSSWCHHIRDSCTSLSLGNSQLNSPGGTDTTPWSTSAFPLLEGPTATSLSGFSWIFRGILNQNNQLFILKNTSIVTIVKLQLDNGQSGETETLWNCGYQ